MKVEKAKADASPLVCLQPFTVLELLRAVCSSLEAGGPRASQLLPPTPPAPSQRVVVTEVLDTGAILRSSLFRGFLMECCSELLLEAEDLLSLQSVHDRLQYFVRALLARPMCPLPSMCCRVLLTCVL